MLGQVGLNTMRIGGRGLVDTVMIIYSTAQELVEKTILEEIKIHYY